MKMKGVLHIWANLTIYNSMKYYKTVVDDIDVNNLSLSILYMYDDD